MIEVDEHHAAEPAAGEDLCVPEPDFSTPAESETPAGEWVAEAGPPLKEQLEREAIRIMDEADARHVAAQARAQKLLAAAEALSDDDA